MAKQVDTTYGNALFELALEENTLDSLYDEVNKLIDILKDNPDIIKLLAHPQIEKSEKKDIIENTFGKRVSDEITGLMIMVMEKGHITSIIDIFNYFIKQVKKEKNIGMASVTSAVSLSDSQKAAIEKRLIETTSYSTMEIEYAVDKSLIGGLIIRIEDRVVDSSIKTKIDNMSKTLANA
ncbi:MAG: F0F1 ATP synthase subunit delta [Lachnospiraceae bacterium]|nr:F0F1 ATP synthase subunit delta [Lachnospiraceae bacterium]